MNKKTALLIKTKHIGDSIILTSTINALPKEFKFVDIIVFPDSADIFLNHPRVRNIFIIPRHLTGLKKIYAYIRLYKEIFSFKYNLLMQFSDDWRGAILSRLLKPELSVARDPLNRGSFWKKSFHKISKVARINRHAAEQDIDLLRTIGLYGSQNAPPYSFYTNPESDKRIKAWLHDDLKYLSSKIVIIHGASRWKFKEIPISIWAAVIDYLHEKNTNVILSGSLQDIDFNYALARQVKKRLAIIEFNSISDTASVFKIASLVISIDSMAIHLASAFNIPTIAIFGPTNEKNWAPWKVSHSIVSLNAKDSASFACRPCGFDGCGGSKMSACLNEIHPANIIEKINTLTKILK